MQVTTVGLDRCFVGIEACGTRYYWTRDLVVRQRTQTINMLRAQLTEFGIVFPQGVGHATQFAKRRFEDDSPNLPDTASNVITEPCEQLLFLHGKIATHTHERTQVARRQDRVALCKRSLE